MDSFPSDSSLFSLYLYLSIYLSIYFSVYCYSFFAGVCVTLRWLFLSLPLWVGCKHFLYFFLHPRRINSSKGEKKKDEGYNNKSEPEQVKRRRRSRRRRRRRRGRRTIIRRKAIRWRIQSFWFWVNNRHTWFLGFMISDRRLSGYQHFRC